MVPTRKCSPSTHQSVGMTLWGHTTAQWRISGKGLQRQWLYQVRLEHYSSVLMSLLHVEVHTQLCCRIFCSMICIPKLSMTNPLCSWQWRSQSAANARAPHGHTMFASSLVSRPRLEFLSFLGRFCGYFRPYRRLELEHFNHAFATAL